MLETRDLGQFRNFVAITLTTFLLGGCLLQDELEESVSAKAAIETEYEVSGSVGDGPVVGAAMRVMQNDGMILHEFQSDASAGYNIKIKTKGKYYPLTIDARNGTDLVTNNAPDFLLIGAALEPSKKYVVNVNPFSTLSMEIAQDLPGGRTKANIYAAQGIAYTSMNFGLVSLSASGPMTARIDAGNVAEIVKSSEALGEVVRRTRDWLLTAGFTWDGDAVIQALGSDLVDGVIDGIGGPRSDGRAAAIANIVIAQVLLESASNELHVNGTDATASLDMAIQVMNLGPASPSLNELTATSAMLGQTNISLAAADAISDDVRVSDLKSAALGLQAGLQPQLAQSILPSDYRQILDDVLVLLITGDAGTIATVNDVVRNGDSLPNDPPPVDPPPTRTNCIDFTTITTSSYGEQDKDRNFTILDGGASIRLDNNTWRRTDTAYTITPNTVVEFTFESSVQGEVHGIGFDEDNAFSADRIFRVYGTQDLGISDFNTYTGPGPETFTIPVGQYFTGSGFHLIVANDDDAGLGANGTFSNIRVYETASSPTAPVINNPGSQSNGINTNVLLTVTATDANGDTLTFSATGLPLGLGITPSGTISGTPTALGTWTVTVTVDDGNGGTDSATFTWTIAQNSAPQINGTPSTSVNEGQNYSFTPTAIDFDGDNLTFSIQNKPQWAQFDTASGTLSGTPTVGDSGSYVNISISVSDRNLSDALPNFTITVNQVSLGSATLTWQPPTQNSDGTALTDLAGYNIYWGTTPGSYPNSVTINNPGLTTYVVDNLAPGDYEFVATAFNESGVESQYSNKAIKTIP